MSLRLHGVAADTEMMRGDLAPPKQAHIDSGAMERAGTEAILKEYGSWNHSGDSTAVQLAGSRSHRNAPCSPEPAQASSRSAAGRRIGVHRQAAVMDRPGQDSNGI